MNRLPWFFELWGPAFCGVDNSVDKRWKTIEKKGEIPGKNMLQVHKLCIIES
jgi:hypothetical protein